MSVFTVVGFDEAAEWVAACGAGTLQELTGVEGGVENTNYRVVTGRGAFVLTLFEWMPEAAACRSLSLTAALADAGLPVARPWRQMDGWLAPLEGKPAALSAWLDGAHPEVPTEAQCAAIGEFLARLHESNPHVGAVPWTANDPRGSLWRERTIAKLLGALDAESRELIDAATALPLDRADLPAGTIHADLFRDNALFDGDELCGVVDFHYACSGNYIDDIAVAALDWCWTERLPNAVQLAALCRGYEVVRPTTAAEREHFPAALVRAAMRFWLSRRYDLEHPRPGADVMVKDPAPMFERLGRMLHEPVQWPA